LKRHDATFAGPNGPLGRSALSGAERAIDNLIQLSSTADKPPLSVNELKAKSVVCRAALEFEEGNQMPEQTRVRRTVLA
jgi:hypothetical protein